MSMKKLIVKKLMIKKLTEPETWISALVGFGAIESFFQIAPKVKLAKVDYSTLNGTIFLPPGKKARVVGGIMFFSGAVAWVTVFRVFKTLIPGQPVFQGYLYGNIVFLFSSAVAMPMLGYINPRIRKGVIQPPGFFGVKLNGIRTVVTNYIGHIIFGFIIGICECIYIKKENLK